MKRHIFISALMLLALLLGSCGNSNSESDCIMATQRDMDQGNYAAVITRMESNAACRSAYGEVDYYRNLSGAYFGLASFEAIGVVGAIASYADSDIDYAYKRFASSFSFNVNAATLQNVVESVNFNIAAIKGQKCIENFDTLNEQSQDTCLYYGLTSIVESLVALWLAVDGLYSWYNGAGTEELFSAGCVIQYATSNGKQYNQACTITESNVTFYHAEQNVTLTQLSVDINNSTYYHLVDKTTLDPVVTFESSTKNLTPCPLDNGTTCFPKPIFYNDYETNTTFPLTYKNGVIAPLNVGLTIVKLIADPNSQTYKGAEKLLYSITGSDANVTYDTLADLLMREE